MMLIYHNITPPDYFLGVHDQLVRQCYHGRRELLPYRTRCELALGDSEFNRQELETLGFPRTAVLPVVPDFTHLAVEPDRRVLDAYDDEGTNILFVGRVIPNKRPVSRLGVRDVEIVGQVTNEELTAYYDVADVFLCASEHEGFCVPLMEAFHKRVPVVALAATAVPATMDGGGVLYDRPDPRRVAAILHGIVSDRDVEHDILVRQDAALARLLTRDFSGMVVRFVEEALALPRLGPPRVAPEFWRQFTLADELERIRETRPAAFRALPRSPDEDGPVADLGHRA
jgi:glycosyltransferase involved in cell wall biosynthesis